MPAAAASGSRLTPSKVRLGCPRCSSVIRRAGSLAAALLRSPMRLITIVALAGVFAGCADSVSSESQRTTSEPKRTPYVESNAQSIGVCPVTLPNRRVPSAARDWPARFSYGNGRLWILLWPHGVVVAGEGQVNRDGSITMKFPWWRGVRGALQITGRLLQRPAQRVSAEVPNAYGSRGFQPTSITFPREGCWEVTGRAGRGELTFVTIVIDGRSN